MSITCYLIYLRTVSEVIPKEEIIEISLYTGRKYLEVCEENTEDLISILNRIKFIFISITAVVGFDSLKRYFEPGRKGEDSRNKVSKKIKERETEEFFI